MSGNKPFVYNQWSDRGIYTLDQLFNGEGMLSFEDLRASFEVPRTSFFLYLRLRSALKCYGVPWGNSLEAHPIIKWLVDSPVRGLVSRIYAKLMQVSVGELPIVKKWEQ